MFSFHRIKCECHVLQNTFVKSSRYWCICYCRPTTSTTPYSGLSSEWVWSTLPFHHICQWKCCVSFILPFFIKKADIHFLTVAIVNSD